MAEASDFKFRTQLEFVKAHRPSIGSVNLVAEHFGVLMMYSTTKFTVPIFAVFDVCVYNTCI